MRPLRVGEGPQADHAVVRHLAPLGLALEVEKDGGGRRRWKQKEEDYKEELLTVEAPEVPHASRAKAPLVLWRADGSTFGRPRKGRGSAGRPNVLP